MSTDREAVVWTRLGGTPRRMGRVYITDSECRFTYEDDYLDSGLPGLGIVYAPEFFGKTTIAMQRNERFDLLPPLQALVPPRNAENFQRNLALKYLASKGATGLGGFDADWEILKVSGHGGIGHLDLFEDDARAQAWYDSVPAHELNAISDELSFSLKEFMTWFEDDIDVLIQTVGPTPSVGGAIPKLLLSIPSSGWDGRIGLPTRQKTPGVTDIVLKFEQTNRYPGIMELEALAMDMHREAGFDVPRFWTCQFKDMSALAVERFDRDADNAPLFTETLFSIIASGTPITDNYSYRYDLIAQAIDTPTVAIATDPQAAKNHLFRRFIMSALTGNGDLHLENLSIMQTGSIRRFTPVYDPAPMRAYSQHDMLAVMSFGYYGDIPPGSNEPAGFAEAVERFAGNCGLSKTRRQDTVNQLLEVTRNYEARVSALATVPDMNKERLINNVRDVRDKLG
ncbi:MAG: HipA domain-containing protein [Halobacteria archaeon]|nr:HipA domain-containing protein [Halobacteria archaeon]